MTPKAGFDSAHERAQHLIRLYELICDTRQRGVRSDWAREFKRVMHWPDGEQIVRVDGKDRQSVLVFRDSCGIDRNHFAHDYLSELLRSAIVASVSALDRLLHDLVVKHSWKLLTQPEEDIPKPLKTLPISAVDTRKAIEHLRKDPTARPGNLVKRAIQEKLHRDYTFQTPDSVLQAGKMLGIDDFWARVANKMHPRPSKKALIDRLRSITQRRNQIVHEADLVRTNRQQPSLRAITLTEARDHVDWMRRFGTAVDKVVEENV